MSRFSTKIKFNNRFCFFQKGRVHFSLFLYLKYCIEKLKINRTTTISLAILCFLASSSCSVFKLPTSFERQWSNPGEILRDYRANYNKLKTLQAKGRLSVYSSEFNENGTIHISVKMPDSLRIKVEGPLGIDVANFFMDSERYLLYLNREEVVYEGSSDTLNISRFLNDIIGITVEDNVINFQDMQSELIGLFTGVAFIDDLDLVSVNFTDSTKTVNLFKMTDIMGEILFEFPKNNELLQKVQIYDDNHNNRIEKSFDHYTPSF